MAHRFGRPKITFSEEQIQSLFGHEAAENEDPARLKEYYFKSKVYARVTADLPVRLVVGHKGIGKSALFSIAMLEDREAGRLAISVKPDDVLAVATSSSDFNVAVRHWKDGLRRIVQDKAISHFQIPREITPSGATHRIGGFLVGLRNTLKPLLDPVVNLDPAERQLLRRFLDGTGRIIVYLDDLDRGWTNDPQDIARLSALLNAVRDLSTDEPGLQFRVALRSDVYFLVRTSDESTDKIESSVVWHSWLNHEILAMLAKRVSSYVGKRFDDEQLIAMAQPDLAQLLEPVLQPRYAGAGKWENAPTYRILMSVIRRRPRDLVKLLTLAARCAADRRSNVIATEDLKQSFSEYSQGRIQDTVNEYKSELPEIKRLLLDMKPTSKERRAGKEFVYTTSELLDKIRRVQEHTQFRTHRGDHVDAKWLAAFMYKINFINARKVLPSTFIDRKYFDENRYLSGHFADFGYDWEIHPAYWWALQPEDVNEVCDRLALTDDSSA